MDWIMRFFMGFIQRIYVHVIANTFAREHHSVVVFELRDGTPHFLLSVTADEVNRKFSPPVRYEILIKKCYQIYISLYIQHEHVENKVLES